MIAYKVIQKETRYGSNAAIYIDEWDLNNFNNLLKENKDLPNYFPKYKTEKYIDYVEGSVGLMCFGDLSSAKEFTYDYNSTILKIIKVRINKKNILKSNYIISRCGSSPLKLLKLLSNSMMTPYSNTIFTKRLFVLE